MARIIVTTCFSVAIALAVYYGHMAEAICVSVGYLIGSVMTAVLMYQKMAHWYNELRRLGDEE